MVKEAILLAGGLGTRLQSVVKDIPKPMAPINRRPFLEFVLDSLVLAGIEHVILSVGYRHDVIQEHFGTQYKTIKLSYSIEDKPLGTGGGILKASDLLEENDFFILNGDTLFAINFLSLQDFYKLNKTDLAIALKPMLNVERYGTVNINKQGRILSFLEKQPQKEGFINGGIYLTNRNFLKSLSLPNIFSFEKAVLERFCQEKRFFGLPQDAYFIDIGIPSDYAKAQVEL